MATILKGAPVVAAMNERNAALCEQLKAKGVVPTLAVVRVGEREDDLSYERGVIARCGKVGVEVKQFLLPADASQDELLKVIAEINAEETLEEHEDSEQEENANASDTDDADGSSNTAINKATDFS